MQKSLKKKENEAVGIFAKKNHKIELIDYAEFSKFYPELVSKKDESGKLLFYLGNILNYVINLENLISYVKDNWNQISSMYHFANKKIQSYSHNQISEISGFKFELFANDFTKFIRQKFLFMEVNREDEFSPVKNKCGNCDTPEIAVQMISTLHKKWLKNAGAILDESKIRR